MSEPDLAAIFAALDTSLSLHYLTNTTDPAVHDLCAGATGLLKRRVGQDAVECVLGVDSAVWTVAYSAARDAYCIGPPKGLSPKTLSGALALRKAHFRERLADGAPAPVPLATLATARESRDKARAASRDKVFKPLANKSKRFSLRELPAAGLSLLERIKAKERAKMSEPKPDIHGACIQGLVPAVYDILYEMKPDKERAFPFLKVVSIIKDSVHSISEAEAGDALLSIAASLPEKIAVLHAGSIKALRILTLDRDADLLKLKRIGRSDSPKYS